MNVLWHWVPTIAGAVILGIAGFILLAKAERDERRARQDGTDNPANSRGSH